jgi:hypothetical protein
MMSVLEYKPIHALVGHLFHAYNPVSLVFLPSCSLLRPWSPVESDFPESKYASSGFPQMFLVD